MRSIRDNLTNLNDYSILGTNCVKEFFSSMGNTNENKHTYSIYDFLKNKRKHVLKKFYANTENHENRHNFPRINKAKETLNNEEYDKDKYFDSKKFTSIFLSDQKIKLIWTMASNRVREIFNELSKNKKEEEVYQWLRSYASMRNKLSSKHGIYYQYIL